MHCLRRGRASGNLAFSLTWVKVYQQGLDLTAADQMPRKGETGKIKPEAFGCRMSVAGSKLWGYEAQTSSLRQSFRAL